MNATSAYGLILLAALGSGSIVWAVCWRYWSARRLPEHDGYCRGFDACSRIRDREEVQERKERLLSPIICTEFHRGGVVEVYKNGVRIK